MPNSSEMNRERKLSQTLVMAKKNVHLKNLKMEFSMISHPAIEGIPISTPMCSLAQPLDPTPGRRTQVQYLHRSRSALRVADGSRGSPQLDGYPLVMTNSLPWKDPPIFQNGKPSISMGMTAGFMVPSGYD